MDLFLQASEAHRAYVERQQDLAFRRIERFRHQIDDTRRSVDRRVEQLRTVANLAALLTGFEAVVLVETNLTDQNAPVWLIGLFAATTAFALLLFLLSMVTASLILVPVLEFNEVGSVMESDDDFPTMWRKYFSRDWRWTKKFFLYGVHFFFGSVITLGWIRFLPDFYAPGIISVSSLFAWAFFTVYLTPGYIRTESPDEAGRQAARIRKRALRRDEERRGGDGVGQEEEEREQRRRHMPDQGAGASATAPTLPHASTPSDAAEHV